LQKPIDTDDLISLDRPAKALRALRIASTMLALLVFAGLVGLLLTEIHVGSANGYSIVVLAALSIFVVTPPTWFALNALRPIFLVPIMALFAWSTIGYLDYVRRAGGPMGIDTVYEMALLFLPLVFMLWAAFRGLLLTRPERAMTRPLDMGGGYFSVLRFVFGVWPGLKRSPAQALVSVLLIYASQVVQALAIVLVAALVMLAPRDFSQAMKSEGHAEGSTALDRAYDAGVLFAVALAGAVALLLLGAVLRNAGRLVSRQSFEKQVGRDRRPPILFLRAFKDDQAILPRGGLFARLLRAELGQRRLDHMLVEEFARFGPVVALGRPGQRIRPFGAARVYVAHDDWQARVTDLAEKAAHIVLVADEGPGVEWEIETMANLPFRPKTIFLTTQRHGDLRTCDQLRLQLGAMEFPPSARIVASFQRREGGDAVLHATHSSPEAYFLTLQAFFRRDQRSGTRASNGLVADCVVDENAPFKAMIRWSRIARPYAEHGFADLTSDRG
jgi:hypothetical protein